MRFSLTTGNFYPTPSTYSALPDDVIDVTKEEHYAAMTRKTGETLSVVNGKLVIVPAQPIPLLDRQRAALRIIDADVDAIYAAVIGNRAPEYMQAEADALDYKAAGYLASPVPPYVQDWADAKSATPTWAADNIIATATQWRAAQGSLRSNRLSAKESIRMATDKSGIDAALVNWEAVVGTIKENLNI
jgi:hypothetical protein